MLKLTPLPRNLAAALRDVTHKRFQVRLSAVQDLGRLATTEARVEALRPLVEALRSDEAPGIRAEALVRLADAKATEALADVIRALGDDHERVRQMAVLALGELGAKGDEKVLELIRAHLDDDEPALRFQALNAYAELAGEHSRGAVLRATYDADVEVQVLALRIAEGLGVVSADGTGPTSADLHDPFRQRVSALLRDDDERVRLSAALLLGKDGGASGAEVIAQALNAPRFPGGPEDEAFAVESAGELGIHGAEPGLRRRAWAWFGISSAASAFQARIALARLGDPRARRFIVNGLSAASRDDRNLAATSAGLARLVEAKEALERLRAHPDRADLETVEEALRHIETAAEAE